MVEQPKFYYKVVPLELEKVEGGKGFHMRKVRYYVSDTKKAGFKLHPAFIQDGVEKNVIYLSAYEGSTFDSDKGLYNTTDAQNVDWTNDLLASIAGAKPTSGLTQSGATRNGFRTIAAKRGAGWSQQTVQAATATELLFLIEYASFNMTQRRMSALMQKVWMWSLKWLMVSIPSASKQENLNNRCSRQQKNLQLNLSWWTGMK